MEAASGDCTKSASAGRGTLEDSDAIDGGVMVKSNPWSSESALSSPLSLYPISQSMSE